MHQLQKQLLELIEARDLGKMSYRKIGLLLGKKSAQLVKHHLQQLEKKGFIYMNKNEGVIKRNESGKDNKSNLLSLPILGTANCGAATQFADEQINGYVRVSKKLLPRKNNLFAIEVIGQSMNKADINGKSLEDGDYAITDKDYSDFKSGDYILSIIDGMANIKKYYEDKKNNQIILASESTKKYPNIHIHLNEATDYIANGKVIAVIKNSNKK